MYIIIKEHNEFEINIIQNGYYIMNLEISKFSDPYWLILNLSDKANLNRINKYTLSNLRR